MYMHPRTRMEKGHLDPDGNPWAYEDRHPTLGWLHPILYVLQVSKALAGNMDSL
jgi:hypothetical protein